jgi:hypothetical protein
MNNLWRLVWILVAIVVISTFFPIRRRYEHFATTPTTTTTTTTPTTTVPATTAPKATPPVAPAPQKKAVPPPSCAMNENTKNNLSVPLGKLLTGGDWSKKCSNCSFDTSNISKGVQLKCNCADSSGSCSKTPKSKTIIDAATLSKPINYSDFV